MTANCSLKTVEIGKTPVGHQHSTYIIGEIGINHNGDLSVAKKMIDMAVLAGCNAVKFQKRTPELCVPPEQRNIMRETPWGNMTYLDYRYKVEFNESDYAEIDAYCKERNLDWFASPWDVPSVDFMEAYNPVCYKVASASITHEQLLDRIAKTGRPVILSTGMSTMAEIERAVSFFDPDKLLIAHATSSYPCQPHELNLKMLHTLMEKFDCPIGYSGHEVGLQATLAAMTLGACFIERHITLDRSMWGTDQSASLEPSGLIRLVRDIRIIESAMGDGVKKVYDSEVPILKKLRVSSTVVESVC